MVSLLLGHIQLHGLQQPEQAAVAYERVLEGDVDTTIAALAEQGLKRCRSEQIASEAAMTPETNGAIADLLKDPFLSTDPDQGNPAPAEVVTAMPWLSSDEEPRAYSGSRSNSPTGDSGRSQSQAQSQQLTLEANSEPVEVEMANRNKHAAKKSHPRRRRARTPGACADAFEHSWLRVQLQPDIKSPTDSVEPMGLFNRIMGVFARSAGG